LLLEDSSTQGDLFLRSVLHWLHIESQALAFMRVLCQAFPLGLQVLEHYGDYYRLRLGREQGSIGMLFGLVEGCRGQVSEYAISQTTLEQIFQTLAGQQ
jgi:hypothetical protein